MSKKPMEIQLDFRPLVYHGELNSPLVGHAHVIVFLATKENDSKKNRDLINDCLHAVSLLAGHVDNDMIQTKPEKMEFLSMFIRLNFKDAIPGDF